VFGAPKPRSKLYTTLAMYRAIARDVLSGNFEVGPAVETFEAAIAAWTGKRHAIAVPMARTGIHLATKALVRPGRKIVLSPYTISDVVNMVIAAGAVPVFADIQTDTLNIDAAEVERLVDDKTDAVLATHFYGLACDVARIGALCRERGIALIEDAAQAFSSEIGGRHAGTFGDVGVFSFGMYKNVNTFFGGIVVTDCGDIAAKIRDAMRTMPPETLGHFLPKVASGLATDVLTSTPIFDLFTYWLFRWAYLNDVEALNNKVKVDLDPVLRRDLPPEYQGRMTETQARIALDQLPRVTADTKARIAAAELYHAGLKDLNGIVLPPLRTDGSHTYSYYCIQVPDREALVRHALRQGRDLTESHHKNCADMACFREWARDCPRARAAAASVVYLPTYPGYGRDEIEKTIAAVRGYFRDLA